MPFLFEIRAHLGVPEKMLVAENTARALDLLERWIGFPRVARGTSLLNFTRYFRQCAQPDA